MVCFFQTAAGIKQAVCFVRDLYVDSKVLVSFQKSKNLKDIIYEFQRFKIRLSILLI